MTATNPPQTFSEREQGVHFEAVNRAVFAVIRDLLLQPGLREQILRLIEQQSAALDADAAEMERLQQERASIAAQVEFVDDELGPRSKDAAKRKLRQLASRLDTIDARIANVSKAKRMSPQKAAEAADAMVATIAAMAEKFDELPFHALRNLLASMIVRLNVDLATRWKSHRPLQPSFKARGRSVWVSRTASH